MTIHQLPDTDLRQQKIDALRAELRSIRAQRLAAIFEKFTDDELLTFCAVADELVHLVRARRRGEA